MALTLSATAAALRACAARRLDEVARAAAEACTLGAKGNSGVILAHWFLALSGAVAGRERVGAPGLAAALDAATRGVYAAIDEVVEGTMVSVMRAVSEQALAHTETGAAGGDLGALLAAMEQAGREALARTPEQLPVLRRANVVDAGAEGWMSFLDGARRLVRGDALPEPAPEAGLEAVVHGEAVPADLAEPYCTEVVVRGRGFRDARLRRAFRDCGSSLLLASTGEIFKLHVHTAHPAEVMRRAARFGRIVERKVDDMRRQGEAQSTRGRAHDSARRAWREQPGSVAVVCDSAVDLPAEVRARHGIEMAPLQVLFGDAVYRDQIDLGTADFYRELARNPCHPTTSQPPPREFVAAMDRIRPDREVVVITISAGVSGTCESARSGARLVPHPRVEIFDSRFVSLGSGFMVLNAARLAERGAALDDILAWLARWRDDTGMIFTLGTLEYVRRGGRIGRARSLIGNLLDVRPILAFEEGELAPVARARGGEDAFERVVDALEQRLPAGASIRLGMLSIGESAQLARLEQHLRRRCRVVEAVRGVPTGVIGAHAGPGAWGAFYQHVRDDDPIAYPPASRAAAGAATERAKTTHE
ncbi:MAG: DegV family protein, partial [Gammaproteobacteria bacterium]|nr:DegV family protein [Gammaproteobacteria bacterium]